MNSMRNCERGTAIFTWVLPLALIREWFMAASSEAIFRSRSYYFRRMLRMFRLYRAGGWPKPLRWLVQLGGLEPPTSGSTIRRSNQLSYSCTRPAQERAETSEQLPFFGKALVAPLVARRASEYKKPGRRARAFDATLEPARLA